MAFGLLFLNFKNFIFNQNNIIYETLIEINHINKKNNPVMWKKACASNNGKV